MRKLTLTLFALITILLLAACGSSGSDDSGETEGGDGDDGKLAELQDKGVIKVGFANEKPYGYENDAGEITGASVETAKAVFAELGIDEVEGHLADYDQLVPGLGAGKFDAITSGMAITPDRCENAAFGEPDMKYGEGLIVQKGNPLDLKSYTDIADNEDATISIMSGATENDFVVSEGVDESQIQGAPDIPATIAAVESGRADATTGTEMTLIDALDSADSDNLEFVEDFEQPDIEGVPSYGAVAFHPDQTELLEAYNDKLAELKESGKIAEILEDNGFDSERNYPEDSITAEMVCKGEEQEEQEK
ncbi:MAG TPA: ectoine/hydroxyectoine ABC transporter substrate-binding protein EhuB [Pseudogracilibacillus sp.]|nr:ectoine/hydroxyectoine ABC transporter substrate-binding protein EhuB [Pseudogracilibacillus sp.]